MSPKYRRRTQSFVPKKEGTQKRNSNEREINLGWFILPFVIGLILGGFSIFWLSNTVVIRYYHIISIMLVLGCISAAIHYPFFKKTPEFDRYIRKNIFMFLFYNIIGVGSIGLFTVLILNNSFSSNDITHEYYEIVGTDPEYKIFRWGNGVFLLENDAFDYDPYWRSMPYVDFFRVKEYPVLEYDYYKGALGFLVKNDRRLIKEKPSSE